MNLDFENIKCLVFDLDNTLIDRDVAFFQYLENAFGYADQENVWQLNSQEIMKFDNHGYYDRKVFDQWLTDYYISESAYKQFQKQYLVADFVQMMEEDLIDFLLDLKMRFSLVLLTNGGKENQHKKIEKSGLSKVFDQAVFVSGEYKIAKPNPLFFQLVEEKTGFLPYEILMIGDDLRNDIEGAKALNWKTAWKTNSIQTHPKSDICIQEINELADYL